MNNFQNIEELSEFLESQNTVNESEENPSNAEGDKEEIPSPIPPVKETERRPMTKMEAISQMNINIDLNKINIVRSDNPIVVHSEVESLFERSTFEVIALKSGYRASFSALNNQDMIRVRKISGSLREQNVKLMRIIFDHMVSSSMGKVSFNNWLQVTAEADYETLIYGIYCATFPREVDYTVTCPHCKAKNIRKISKNHLVQVIDKNVYQYVDTVINERKSVQELIRESELNNKTRVILPESKIVIDIALASIDDLISSLRNAESYGRFEKEIFGYLKHLSNIYVPVLGSFQKGEPSWLEVTGIEEQANVIANIPFSDRSFLEKAISEKTDKNTVSYCLPDQACASCNEMIKKVSIDMTEVLFQNIAKG